MGDIIGSIFGFFAGLGSFFGGLSSLLDALGKLAAELLALLQHIWQFIVKKIIGGILSALGSLSAWIKAKLTPSWTSVRTSRHPRALLQHLLAPHAGVDAARSPIRAHPRAAAHPHCAAPRYLPRKSPGEDPAGLLHRHRRHQHTDADTTRAAGSSVPHSPPGTAGEHPPADPRTHSRCHRPAAWNYFPSPRGSAGGNFAPTAGVEPIAAQNPPASTT